MDEVRTEVKRFMNDGSEDDPHITEHSPECTASSTGTTTRNSHAESGTPVEGASETKEEYHSLLQVVRLWTEGTSTHGVRYAFDPNFFPWKHIAWSVFVTAMATIMVLATVALVDSYLQYDTQTSYSAIARDRLPFPEVVVCNASPYQQSLREKYNITWPRNDEEIDLISQPFEEFILGTKFSDLSYFWGNFTHDLNKNWHPVITNIGRCWSFRTNKKVSVPGQTGGLSVLINIQQDEYMPEAPVAGVLYSVAQPGTFISEQVTLNAIPPGAIAAVAFRSHEIQLETTEPWSSCKSEAPEYTQTLCRQECFNQARARTCGCRTMGVVQPELQDLDYCLPSDPCIPDLAFMENCSCSKPPCHEFLFPLKSTATPMSKQYQKSLEASLNVTENYISDNILLVTMNFETMVENVVEETRVQGPYDLMAAIGGVTGLYMGVSLISLVEIFGELLGLRMIPRLWGDSRLYGIGGRT